MKKVDFRSIFASWPKAIKHIFFNIVLLHGFENVKTVYHKLGYGETADMIFSWFDEHYPNFDHLSYPKKTGVQENLSLLLQGVQIKQPQKKKEKVTKFALDIVQKQQKAIQDQSTSLPYDSKTYRRALVVAKPWLRRQQCS